MPIHAVRTLMVGFAHEREGRWYVVVLITALCAVAIAIDEAREDPWRWLYFGLASGAGFLAALILGWTVEQIDWNALDQRHGTWPIIIVVGSVPFWDSYLDRRGTVVLIGAAAGFLLTTIVRTGRAALPSESAADHGKRDER